MLWEERGVPDIELVKGANGILPGDKSFVFEKEGKRFGFVGLNSTWLQFDDADCDGKLHVDARQLHAVTQDDPDKWSRENQFNALITHHPTSWLDQESRNLWNSNINPAGRFSVHLYGHMHETAMTSLAEGGSPIRASIQAASTFGLVYSKGGATRFHGYSVARLSARLGAKNALRVWPRKLRKIASGSQKLGPDLDFDLDEINSFQLAIEVSDALSAPTEPNSTSLQNSSPNSVEALQSIKHQFPIAPAHANVRRIEQRNMIEALEDRRVAWLITDWGMGDDGFIASVRQSKRQSEVAAYRLDLTEYENHEDFIDSIKPAVGCNFYQLCEAISNAGKSWLMLDGFPSGEQSLLRDGNTLDADLEDFVDVVLEYCPETVILIRARRAPIQPRNPVVHLRPLDEGNHPL